MVTFGLPDSDAWQQYKTFISIDPTCIVAPEAAIKFTVPPQGSEKRLIIKAESHVYAMFSYLRADAKIVVGKRCQIGNVNFISSEEIIVGDDVLMAWGINITDSNHHSLFWEERKNDVYLCRKDYIATNGRLIGASMDWNTISRGPIVIGDKVWLGFNVSILKGVTIGEGAVVSPGSVVTKDVPAWTLVGGVPCKPIRKLTRSRL